MLALSEKSVLSVRDEQGRPEMLCTSSLSLSLSGMLQDTHTLFKHLRRDS